MDDGEQCRHALDFVDHHGSGLCASEQLPQPLRAGFQAPVAGGVQQIDEQGIGQAMPQPSGFAGAARTEQEAGLFGDVEESTY